MNLRQLQCEIEVAHKTIHRPIERFARGLDVPPLDLIGPVEIYIVDVSAGKKGHELDSWSLARGLSTRGRGTYDGDKLPMFLLADRGRARVRDPTESR